MEIGWCKRTVRLQSIIVGIGRGAIGPFAPTLTWVMPVCTPVVMPVRTVPGLKLTRA